VLLYEKSDQLRVLLTTRSKSLRSHPGQTAFPGGKVDDEDADVVGTAFREAFEEVDLPLDSPHIYTIGQLLPVISAGKLLVIPIVALLTDLSILDHLKASDGEVDRIFNHPLEAILDPSLCASEPLSEKGGEDWSYDADYYCYSDIVVPWETHYPYRMHRFRSSASPVKGLTAEVLISVATLAYDKNTSFPRTAEGQQNMNSLGAVMKLWDSLHAVS